MILDALEAIKKKKAGQYHENFIDLCAEEYGWTEAETEAAINAAKAHSLIKEVKKMQQKTNLDLQDPLKAILTTLSTSSNSSITKS